ncbi:hypothetical protein CHS0354_037154 [Potamilus streckersoni]|uniref:Hexosyltransferase n=1 Tax=Potamilus streckersoni TaxID=2493646 RepID=A0AAE0RPC2_9BIVA|nr:hypothetical protein CHS0354_037154 [Potamilus streckersoni]
MNRTLLEFENKIFIGNNLPWLFTSSCYLKYKLSDISCFRREIQSYSTEMHLYGADGNPENNERRRMVRETWGEYQILKTNNASLVFTMGYTSNRNVSNMVEEEIRTYGDIIRANFTDSYRNLTYKAAVGMKWVTQCCQNTTYVLKIDDDIVLDIHRLMRFLKAYVGHKWGNQGLLMCHVWPKMDVQRNASSKWYTSKEDYPKDYFLQYCSGSAYVMTPDVVREFYHVIPQTPFFWIDDYYVTGLLAKHVNVSHRTLNDRYLLDEKKDILQQVQRDRKTRLLFVHPPNITIAYQVWEMFVHRQK